MITSTASSESLGGSAQPNHRSGATASLFGLPVIVAALGYFVDIYDLLLFGIVRVPSLKDLGLTTDQISTVGGRIINWQMAGLLLGGILWGILGDKRGRLSVLFGSIVTYSIANIACGFVKHITFMDPVTYYALMRFVAGIGLAGELGAGITLVSEILPKEKRAIGTSLVAAVGVLGAIVAYFTVKLFDWETAFFVGGGLGFCLLLLRIGVVESGMFTQITEQKHVSRGNFLSFFTNMDRLKRYLKCIGIGIPTWFITGILASFSNEFGKALGIADEIQPGLAITWLYFGMAIGDLSNGFISQALKSRKKAIALFMGIAFVFSFIYLYLSITSAPLFYALCLCLGFGNGYWAMFVTISAEQFGTNLRATAATTVPNMVRAFLIPMTLSYQALKPSLDVINAGAIVGLVSFLLGFYAILTIPETHDKELNYLEE
ncbi:MFS transporter [Spirosoma sp. KCTC 42546]|uniref:MFS transporter n=1 Tax=Spirosoma sp. KCTC 42546 TaxID=2520506 RepID=UPI001157003D|nr:MFS transporter [Spirosoma sp. KCTC 42546]QDK81201.1 MFS transporter [Spirosoma sp. KCTC 42546]